MAQQLNEVKELTPEEKLIEYFSPEYSNYRNRVEEFCKMNGFKGSPLEKIESSETEPRRIVEEYIDEIEIEERNKPDFGFDPKDVFFY